MARASAKHSSLFCATVSEEKKFNNIDNCSQGYRNFFLAAHSLSKKARVFVSGKSFQPYLKLECKGIAYPISAP
jgi:hypothetical protein